MYKTGNSLGKLERYLLIIIAVIIMYTGMAQGFNEVLVPSEGPPGTHVTVTGRFGPGHVIDVEWDGKVTTDSNGDYTAYLIVPSNVGTGVKQLMFYDEQGRTFSVANFNITPQITYKISVSTLPTGLSPQPTGAGTYNKGQTATVRAQQVAGYTFMNWTENGIEVSTSMSYSFTVTKNRNLVATYLHVPSCSNAMFIIPNGGPMGWPYMDNGTDVLYEDNTIHRGIDIFAPANSKIYAPYNGKVVTEAPYFRIRHSTIGVDTYYGHMNSILPKGKDVKKGDPIGTLLDLGSNTHLHFTITKLDPNYKDSQWADERIFNNSIDPSSYLNAKLNFFDGTPESYDNKGNYNTPVVSWCNLAPAGIVQGVVKTPDGKGVSNAVVKIEGVNQSRITDYWMDTRDRQGNEFWQNLNKGQYKFSNAPVREVKITASKQGVGSGSVSVTVKASATVTAPDIILRPVQGSSYVDDFSKYPIGQPPNGWLLRGVTEVTPTIEEVGGTGPTYRLVNFPEVPWQYWDKWLLKNGFIPSPNYTIKVKLNFQNNIADRAGLTIAWNDSDGTHIDIQPNVYGDEIEFRPMASPNLVVTKYNPIVINGYTDYWLKVIVTDNGPNKGIADIYWSKDNVGYIHVLKATGLARVKGLVGISTAGPHLPHMHFDNFSVIPNTPKDKLPPTSITQLKNITYKRNYINWTWKDPKDLDFSKVMVYINGVFKTNVSKGKQYYNATGLLPDRTYKISTHTVDTGGNVNMTWKNHTARTAGYSVPPIAPSDLLSMEIISD